jgi:CPA1 family monovalent cation:H+ antiporter
MSLSFLALLLISSFTFLFTRKFNLPYTVVLVIVGLLLVPLSQTHTFDFINHFKLTPDVLFYIFLPILLFEASYKINYTKMLKDWRAIGILAVI